MARYKCTVCGYIYDEDVEGKPFNQLECCPLCKQPLDKFVRLDDEPAQADAFGYTDGPTSVLIAPNSTAAEDEELIAVLAAAILMMEQSSGGQKLVIRDIKYMGTEGSPWAAAGRRDLMSQR